MIFARTVHSVTTDDKGNPRVATGAQAWSLRPGASFETQDGAIYDVPECGGIRRRGKIKAPKKLRRKARAIIRKGLAR